MVFKRGCILPKLNYSLDTPVYKNSFSPNSRKPSGNSQKFMLCFNDTERHFQYYTT